MKPVVIILIGPLHLYFYATNLYIKELTVNYNVVAIVPENITEHPDVIKSLNLNGVVYHQYSVRFRGLYFRHRNYVKLFSSLIEQYHPVFVFVHGSPYVESQYMLEVVGAFSGIKSIRYPFSKYANDLQRESRVKVELEQRKLAKFIPIKNGGYVFLSILYVIEFYVLPLLVLGRILKPGFNVYTYQPRQGVTSADYALIDSPGDSLLINDRGEKNPVMVRFQSKIDCCVTARDVLVVLPTYGILTELIEVYGEREAMRIYSSKWISVLKKLSSIYELSLVVIKLHPSGDDEFGVKEAWNKIISATPKAMIKDSCEKAELLFNNCLVVISDGSTVLWSAVTNYAVPIAYNYMISPCSNMSEFHDCNNIVSIVHPNELNGSMAGLPKDKEAENGKSVSLLEWLGGLI